MKSMNSKILNQAIVSSAGVFLYVCLIAWILKNADRLFDSMENDIRGPILFLMLFVFSASVVGLSVFGRPVYLFLSGSRKEAVTLLLYTVIGLFVLTFFTFLFVAVS